MAELFTEKEVEDYMRSEVDAAGGVRKWLKKHPTLSLKHVEHMVADGRAATLANVLPILGFRKVVRYEPIGETTRQG